MPKKSSDTVSLVVAAVMRRMNDSALVRRPLRRHRPANLFIRRRVHMDGSCSSDGDDYEDDSPDYDPTKPEPRPDERSISVSDLGKKPFPPRGRAASKRKPLSIRNASPPSKRSKKRKLASSTKKTTASTSASASALDTSSDSISTNSSSSPSTAPKRGKFSTSTTTPKSIVESQDVSMIEAKTVDPKLWGESVPMHILHRIFEMAAATEPSMKFLARMQKVCLLWRQVASSPRLWSNADVEYLASTQSPCVFVGLTKYASGIQELSVSRWVKLQTGMLEDFLKLTKDLRALNISFCRALDLRRLLCGVIPEHCPKLRSLDLSYIDPTGQKRITAVLREFLSLESGRLLKRLYLNGNALADLRPLCAESARNGATQNIRVLDLSRVCSDRRNSSKIRLVDFVEAFPNLHVLHMADAMLDFICTPEEENTKLIDVWPNLQDCNISSTSQFGSYRDLYDVFIRLLGRCKNLRRLDLSGLSIYDRLIWLRETPLTYLNLSRVRQMAQNAVTMDFFLTWGLSLETLCIAWVSGYVESLCILFQEAKTDGLTPRLKRLDLTGTCVTADQLRILLDVCQSLEFVDVQSCRGMPLGMKRAFDGLDEIEALRVKLSELAG